MQSNTNELTTLLSTIKQAGNAIIHLQETGFTVSRKANYDLLTQADLKANEILKSHLTSQFPQYGWLSEECVDDVTRLTCKRVWIVDPIDGTKEFASCIPEYAISVALVENGEPILAAVFNPAANQLFHAIKGEGAYLNGDRIHCNEQATQSLILLASRSEYKRGEWDVFENQHQVNVIGSIAYKLALVAAGLAHATFSLGPKSEWDIAAGVLLVTEAGGVVTNQRGVAFVFNQPTIVVDGIIATTQSTNALVMKMIAHSQAVTRN